MFTRYYNSAFILCLHSFLRCYKDIAVVLAVQDMDRSCGLPPITQTICIPVKQWNDFSNALANHAALTASNSTTSSNLLFCPFTAKPPASSSTVEISHTISLVCQQEHKCILDSSIASGNTLVRIKGPRAQVRFHGFTFQGGGQTFSAVHIVYGVVQTQSFCSCIFQRYVQIIYHHGKFRTATLYPNVPFIFDLFLEIGAPVEEQH